MSSDTGGNRGPYARPGFIAAAGVVALIVVCALILVIVNLGRPDPGPAPMSTTSAPLSSEAPSTSTTSTDASICSLGGVELSGSVTKAPAATWAYEGTTGYPTSAVYGPGQVAAEGYRYCFQHSPTGALFAAANALAAPSTLSQASAWTEYFYAPGPYRGTLLEQTEGNSNSVSTTRLGISGFRLLSYDGKTARVDVGGQGSSKGSTVTFSAVYNLVWAAGDWKLDTSTSEPFNFAGIPNLAGYTTWGP